MTYVDTFDWRLYQKGSRLAAAVEDGTLVLFWRPPGEESFCRLPVEAMPDFVWDLPAGPIKDQVESVVDVRRLLPVAELSLEGTLWDVVDRRQKTLLTVVLECGAAVNPVDPERRHRLPPALRVIPVKGYRDEYRKARAAIERDGPNADSAGPLDLALEIFDRHPLDEVARPAQDLQPDQRSDVAMKSVHRRQLLAMKRNVEGLRGNVDTEFLHDFRVAVRRTRSALAQVPEVFPRAATERFRRGFSWLGQATGPLRDLDVYLLSLPRYSERQPKELRPALVPIERYLHRQHRLEHRRLVASLGTSRFRQLVEGWEEFLGRDVPARTSLRNATREIGELAGERIRRSHRQVIKKGKAIKDGSPPARLHRLRIECKKLRYLLEFFAPLYAERDVRRLVGALKKLQNNLGDYNDYVLQQKSLKEIVQRLSESGSISDPTERAVQEILRQLEGRQRTTRKAFQSRFKAFSDRKVTAVFDRLFGEARD
jgi:CHAD domain-containing protein